MAAGRRKEYDEPTVVRAARDVFWERGYASTSLADLEAATGLNRSSIYQTFGSKRGLFDRALKSYCDEVVWPLVEPLEADGAGRDDLVTYFLALGSHLRRSPRSAAARGCMITNTGAELNVLDSDATRVVHEFRQRVRAAIFHALGGMADRVQNREGKADILTAAQFGLMIDARVGPTAAAQVAETIAADVKSW